MPKSERNIPSLVSAKWLFDNLDKGNLKVVDVSNPLSSTGKTASIEFCMKHIPGAIFLDQPRLSMPDSIYPNTVPNPEYFSEIISEYGLTNTDHIIVYDVDGLGAAPRAWWLFNYFGHHNISVLDGGLKKWVAEGMPIESGNASPPSKSAFRAQCSFEMLARYQEITEINLSHLTGNTNTKQIVDARSKGRFLGMDPEPNPTIPSGHMAGSINLPWTELINKADGTMLSKELLLKVFADHGVDINRPLIASCGSGVTACTVLIALDSIGVAKYSLYDGSWSEWASLNSSEIVVTQRGQ
jgi:thiosulfate/3-mercaptopyruvate sulfurtransferase